MGTDARVMARSRSMSTGPAQIAAHLSGSRGTASTAESARHRAYAEQVIRPCTGFEAHSRQGSEWLTRANRVLCGT